jgi:hypothetical protein
MHAECLTEEQYVNLLRGVAILHDCRIEGVDLDDQTIDVSGIPKALHSYALDLEKLLGRKEIQDGLRDK